MNISRKNLIIGIIATIVVAAASVFLWNQRSEILHYQLMAAASNGDVGMLSNLVNQGIDVNRRFGGDGETALHRASAYGRTNAAQFLLTHGADPNINDATGLTPLLSASYHGYLDIVSMLIDRGANINAPEKDGMFTPLHEATMKGHTKIVEFLLAHGANPMAKTKDGRTAFDWARAEGREDVLRAFEAYEKSTKGASANP
jgi:uncharacterized protein